MKVKTIDIIALEWFDKANGNSYFAGNVTVNYGMKTEKTYPIPFQYGYGDQYQYAGMYILDDNKIINIPDRQRFTVWTYCKDNNIILRTVKHENCRKRELTDLTQFRKYN